MNFDKDGCFPVSANDFEITNTRTWASDQMLRIYFREKKYGDARSLCLQFTDTTNLNGEIEGLWWEHGKHHLDALDLPRATVLALWLKARQQGVLKKYGLL